MIPLSACRRDRSALPNEPEKDAADLAQLPEMAEVYANVLALGLGGAKPAQSGEHTGSRGAQFGAEDGARLTPPSGKHNPLWAVMEKYPREFDELPHPFDHRE
jgi:hypothetical protein